MAFHVAEQLQDPLARTAVEQAGRALGEAVTAICSITDPELVVLGGPIGTDPLLLQQVDRTVGALAPTTTPVMAGALGEKAPLLGALERARHHARPNLQPGLSDTGREATRRRPSRSTRSCGSPDEEVAEVSGPAATPGPRA